MWPDQQHRLSRTGYRIYFQYHDWAKEKMCLVVNDYEAAKKDAEESHACEKNYELPDGRKILIGKERFMATEILFQPKEAGSGFSHLEGVHKYCYDSVYKCDVGVRKDLF